MVAPVYLTPQYITYDMLALLLNKTGVLVTDDPGMDVAGIYIGQVNDLMAKGESWVIKTILSNYVQIPLTTIINTGFDDLYNNPDLSPKYMDTYDSIRDMFISSAMWQIYKTYFSFGGNNNGNDLIRQYANKISVYTATYGRLDQAGNPLVKNAFAGLLRATNGSHRIGSLGKTACGIPTGADQAWADFNAQPNLRRSFRG